MARKTASRKERTKKRPTAKRATRKKRRAPRSKKRVATKNTKPARKKKGRATRRWSGTITSDSTHPPKGLFTKDAATIARSMASKRVSPKGTGSGIRMIQMFINRAGKSLSPTRRRELERAKRILQKGRKSS